MYTSQYGAMRTFLASQRLDFSKLVAYVAMSVVALAVP